MLEELTDLHRRRGENAQMIVDLNGDLGKLRQQLAATDQLLVPGGGGVRRCGKMWVQCE